MPPLVGFIGKVYLFIPAYKAGFVWLVVIALINSAISAVYYLRIASVCFLGEPAPEVEPAAAPARRWGAAIAAVAAVVLGVAGSELVDSAHRATTSAQRQAAERGSASGQTAQSASQIVNRTA